MRHNDMWKKGSYKGLSEGTQRIMQLMEFMLLYMNITCLWYFHRVWAQASLEIWSRDVNKIIK